MKKAPVSRIPTRATKTIHKFIESPLLFSREFLKIKDKNGRLIPFVFNDLQRRRYLEVMRDYWKPYKTMGGHPWKRIQGVRYVDLKFRQWGESTLWCALYFYDTIVNEGTDTKIYCHDATFSGMMLEKHKLFYEKMPKEIKPILGANSGGKLGFPSIMSSVSAATPGSSESVADKQGRSTTIRNVHMSEFSMWPNPKITLNAVNEAVPKDGNIFIESSPNKAGDYYHALYRQGKEEGGYWTSHFTPWFKFGAYKMDVTESEARAIMSKVNEDEARLIKEFDLNAGQIAWRRSKLASKNNDSILFLKEYPEDDEQCFEITGSSIFEESLRILRCEQRAAIPGNIHAIGVDVGAGIESGDWSTIEVIDTITGENCYSWRGCVTPDDLAMIAYQVWLQYPGLVGIEANSVGSACLNRAYKIDDWLPFLFANNTTYGGWLTTSANKPAMIFNLRWTLLQAQNGNPGLLLGSKYASGEMRYFQHLRKGGMGAPSSSKNSEGDKLTDDSLMALGIANAIQEWVVDILEEFYERFGEQQ